MKIDMNNVNEKILLNLQKNLRFKKECQEVRKKIKQSGATIRKDEKTGILYIKNFGLQERLIIKEPYRIAGLFRLPSEWSVSIQSHILTGNPLQPPPLQVLWQFNKDYGRWELLNLLHTKTTQTDVEAILKATKKSRQSLKEFSPKEISDIKLLILREYKRNKNYEQIQAILKNKKINMEVDTIKRYSMEVRKQLGIKSMDKKTSRI